MRPTDFFEVAELLRAGTGPYTEGCERSAVSRYYYSAYLDARDKLLAAKNVKLKGFQAHDKVRKAYERADPKPLKLIGRLLWDLKKMRESADYEIDQSFDSVRVAEALRIAIDIQESLTREDLSACLDPRVA